MDRPKIVAIKHQQPGKKKKKQLTTLEESILEEVEKRGEPELKEPQEEQTTQAKEQAPVENPAEKPGEKKEGSKPKIVEKKEFPLAAGEPAEKKKSILRVQEDIVREMREQALKDITPLRREIGKPLQVTKPEEEKLPPDLEKKRLVDEAIRKHEENEKQKSFARRLLKRIGFS